MSKHTPGPWKARYAPDRAPPVETWCIDWSEDHEEIAEIVHGEANARLIAAAPELLEALKAIVDEQDARQGYASVQSYDAARAAIAKATGGQP